MNYFDILLAKKLEDDRDPKVEGLSVSENGRYHEDGVVYDPVIVNVPQTSLSKLTVTENGTYTAPTGTGYNEVDVNVPLPENAYLLKEIENTPTAIATFSDGANLPMPKLEVAIEPVQDLHGYDAPWVGGAGKNKFNIDAEHTSETGTYTYNYVINVKPNTNYTMSTNAPQTSPASLYFNGGNTGTNGVWDGTPRTFTSDENGKLTALVRFSDIQGGIDLYNAVKNGQYYIQLEEGSTATSYAPYSNICPINGWTGCEVGVVGKNFSGELEIGSFAESSQIGLTYDEMKIVYSARIRSKWLIPTFNNNIVISCDFANYQYCFCLYDENKKYLGQEDGFGSWKSVPYTPSTPSGYVAIVLKRNDGATITSDDLENCHLQIELGSTATAYEPYNGQTYTIDLNGTRYGGTLDLVSGVLTLMYEYVDMGTLTWTYGNDFFRTTDLNATIKKPANNYAKANVISSIYTVETWNAITNTDNGKLALSAGTADPMLVCNTDYTDAQAFKTAMDGVQLVYELATPLTIQLSPTAIKSLLGVNNLWADSGDVIDGEYFSKEV